MTGDSISWPSNKFTQLDRAYKVSGYQFEGYVVSAFATMAGLIRLVVDNGDGMLHIFNEEQLELQPEETPYWESLGNLCPCAKDGNKDHMTFCVEGRGKFLPGLMAGG